MSCSAWSLECGDAFWGMHFGVSLTGWSSAAAKLTACIPGPKHTRGPQPLLDSSRLAIAPLAHHNFGRSGLFWCAGVLTLSGVSGVLRRVGPLSGCIAGSPRHWASGKNYVYLSNFSFEISMAKNVGRLIVFTFTFLRFVFSLHVFAN